MDDLEVEDNYSLFLMVYFIFVNIIMMLILCISWFSASCSGIIFGFNMLCWVSDVIVCMLVFYSVDYKEICLEDTKQSD